MEDLTGNQTEVIAGSVAANGRRVALTLGGLNMLGDLHVYDLEQRKLTRLWGANDDVFAAVKLGEVEEIEYASADGTRIQGWLVKPPEFDPKKKYPLVLEIHGGPHTAYGVGFFHEFRVLAAAGYLVLYTNPRGSTSYGQKFGELHPVQVPRRGLRRHDGGRGLRDRQGLRGRVAHGRDRRQRRRAAHQLDHRADRSLRHRHHAALRGGLGGHVLFVRLRHVPAVLVPRRAVGAS